MSDYATKKDVQEIVDKAVTELSEIIADFANQTSKNFIMVDKRFDSIDVRFDRVESDISDLKAAVVNLNDKYDRLLATIDSFIKRIDRYETENSARDAQVARLERWIEQIAQKTGIKLEY